MLGEAGAPWVAVAAATLNCAPTPPVAGGLVIAAITRSGEPIAIVPTEARQLLFSFVSATCDVRAAVPGPESAQATTLYVPDGVPAWIVSVVVALSVCSVVSAPTLRTPSHTPSVVPFVDR